MAGWESTLEPTGAGAGDRAGDGATAALDAADAAGWLAGPPLESLLERFADTPRENGTATLFDTSNFLASTLEGVGLDVELFHYVAEPYALRVAGVIALLASLAYWRWMREAKPRRALAVALAAPAILIAQIDFGVPIFGWVGALEQVHVLARVPNPGAERRLLLSAHYDTKTDLLDHVEREPLDRWGGAIVIAMLAAAAFEWRRQRSGPPRMLRASRLVVWLAPAYGFGLFAALSAGAFVPERSPGAVDNGGSCMVALELARRLAAEPPADTEVLFVFFSGEEVGVQGSRVFVDRWFADPIGTPTRVVNLEAIGQGGPLAVLGREAFGLPGRSYAADPMLAEELEAVHAERHGRPIHRPPSVGATDGRSFLARGVPALTLFSQPREGLVARGLHSGRDTRERLSPEALARTVSFLEAFVRRRDGTPDSVR